MAKKKAAKKKSVKRKATTAGFDKGRALLFGRFSDAAYRGQGWRSYSGLSKMRNEELCSIDSTNTQFLGARWNNDVVIAFRGTEETTADFGVDLQIRRVDNAHGIGKVHGGFQRAARSSIAAVKRYIRNMREKDSQIFVCGHSLGGALAQMTAYWLRNDEKQYHPAQVYTYGAPRIGDADFVRNYASRSLRAVTFNFVAGNDVVPTVPPFSLGFRHTTPNHWHLSGGRAQRLGLDQKQQVAANQAGVEGIATAKEILSILRSRSTDDHSMKDSYVTRLKSLK